MSEYLDLLTDPNHILFELTMEAITGILVYPFFRLLYKRAILKHDKEFHPNDVHKK